MECEGGGSGTILTIAYVHFWGRRLRAVKQKGGSYAWVDRPADIASSGARERAPCTAAIKGEPFTSMYHRGLSKPIAECSDPTRLERLISRPQWKIGRKSIFGKRPTWNSLNLIVLDQRQHIGALSGPSNLKPRSSLPTAALPAPRSAPPTPRACHCHWAADTSSSQTPATPPTDNRRYPPGSARTPPTPWWW